MDSHIETCLASCLEHVKGLWDPGKCQWVPRDQQPEFVCSCGRHGPAEDLEEGDSDAPRLMPFLVCPGCRETNWEWE